MTLSPSLRKQIQADLFEFEANIVYIESFRTVKGTKINPVSKKTIINKQTNTILETY